MNTVLLSGWLLCGVAWAQSPVTLIVNTKAPGDAIPENYIGLSFGPAALHSHTFDSTNTQAIGIFRELGIKYFRLGGTWSDTNSYNYVPSTEDIDALFRFVKSAGIKDVIYTLKLENGDAEQDAAAAKHIWENYREYVTCFAIGNEPDIYRGGDPDIQDYATYLAKWRKFADVISRAVPGAKFGGPDNTTGGKSWVSNFARDEKGVPYMGWILAHDYVGGTHKGKTGEQMLEGMLSRTWDTVKYPAYYEAVGATALSNGFAYRMTEANSYSGGQINGVHNSFATALFALDFMHWWAGHKCSGVSVHTGLSNLNGAIYRDKQGNWRVYPFAYGIKAFDLGGHGRVTPLTLSNPADLNLTAYAVTAANKDLFVTVINREHGDRARNTEVTIVADGAIKAATMLLSAPHGDVSATGGVTLGGSSIGGGSWRGAWIALDAPVNGRCNVSVPAVSAAVVRISGK